MTEAAAQALLPASFTDPSGKPQALSQWQDKVLVVNFWAAWCPPCREEIPVLKGSYKKYVANGVEFVGIALDNAAKVWEYASQMNIDYTLRIGGPGSLAISHGLGNPAGVLPFTVVLN